MCPAEVTAGKNFISFGSEIPIGKEKQLNTIAQRFLTQNELIVQRFYVSHVDLLCNFLSSDDRT